MKVLCVDDEPYALDLLLKHCENVERITSYKGFTNPLEAFEYAKTENIDVALLDIDMPEINGLQLAKKLKQINPLLNIIFCTAYDQYALQALAEDCSGYLLKPILLEDLEHQLDILRFKVEKHSSHKIRVQCFGNFEIFVNGAPLQFVHGKTKELLAYLIDRKGALVTTREIKSIIWEDEGHDEYMKVIRRDLLKTCESNGISDFIIASKGLLGINKEILECDYYDFILGKAYAINAYRGEYMNQYSWAEYTNSTLFNDESSLTSKAYH